MTADARAPRDPLWLAVDPSLTACGFALIAPGERLDTFLCETWTVATSSRQGDLARVTAIAAAVAHAWRTKRIARILVEVPTSLYTGPGRGQGARGRSITALKVLLAIGAVMSAEAFLGVPVSVLAVGDWRNRRIRDKSVMIELAQSLWPQLAGADDHVCDAALIGLAAIYPEDVRAALDLVALGVPVEKARDPIVHRERWGHGPATLALARLETLTRASRLIARARRRGR